MNTPNRIIMDSAIKKDFNGNDTRLIGGKWPLEDQIFNNRDRSLSADRTKILN